MPQTNGAPGVVTTVIRAITWLFYRGPKAGIRWLLGRASNVLAVLWLAGMLVFVGTIALRARVVRYAELKQLEKELREKPDAGPPKPVPQPQKVQIVVENLEDPEEIMQRRLDQLEGFEDLRAPSIDHDGGGAERAARTTERSTDGGVLGMLAALKEMSRARGVATEKDAEAMKKMIEQDLGESPTGSFGDPSNSLSRNDVEMVFPNGGLAAWLQRAKAKQRRRIDDPETLRLMQQQLTGEDIATLPQNAPPESAPSAEAPSAETPLSEAPVQAPIETPVAARELSDAGAAAHAATVPANAEATAVHVARFSSDDLRALGESALRALERRSSKTSPTAIAAPEDPAPAKAASPEPVTVASLREELDAAGVPKAVQIRSVDGGVMLVLPAGLLFDSQSDAGMLTTAERLVGRLSLVLVRDPARRWALIQGEAPPADDAEREDATVAGARLWSVKRALDAHGLADGGVVVRSDLTVSPAAHDIRIALVPGADAVGKEVP